jgi:3-oxoadipate enol-lactonase
MWDQHGRRLAGSHCLAPDLPGHGRSNHLPWSSPDDTTRQVAELIEGRVPARPAHVVGLSLGGVVAHRLLAHRPALLDRVVIDGAGVLPAQSMGLWKLGMALGAPFIHRRLVISLLYRASGVIRAIRRDGPVSPRTCGRSRRPPCGGPSPTPTTTTGSQGRAQRPLPDPAGGRGATARGHPGLERRLAALLPNAVARVAPGGGHGWLAGAAELHPRCWWCCRCLLARWPWPRGEVRPGAGTGVVVAFAGGIGLTHLRVVTRLL